MTGCKWQHDGYYHHLKNNICIISNSIIRNIWPKGNENNRNRAKQLVQCGSIVALSLQYIECASRLDVNTCILLFKCNIIPSMKSKVRNTLINDETHDA